MANRYYNEYVQSNLTQLTWNGLNNEVNVFVICKGTVIEIRKCWANKLRISSNILGKGRSVYKEKCH